MLAVRVCSGSRMESEGSRVAGLRVGIDEAEKLAYLLEIVFALGIAAQAHGWGLVTQILGLDGLQSMGKRRGSRASVAGRGGEGEVERVGLRFGWSR